jgi:Bacterial PH domain
MSKIPARPRPNVRDVPDTVVYPAGVFNVVLVFFAPAFVSVMLGAIVVGLGLEGEEPSFGYGGAALVIAATVACVAGAAAAAVRVRRMRLEVSPEGLRVVNFWSGRSLRWDEIDRVETRAHLALAVAVATVGAAADRDIPVQSLRGVRVRLKDPRASPLGIGVVSLGDPLRDEHLQRALVALRREGEAHGVPVGF